MSNPFEDANNFIDESIPKLFKLANALREAGANSEIINALYRAMTALENIPEFDSEGNIK